MALLFNKLKVENLAKVSVRYKNGPNHWSVLRKKQTSKDKALQHFDEFYGSVYGKRWLNMRDALLKNNSKYVAVVNNFSDSETTRLNLELLGAVNLRALYNVQRENMNDNLKFRTKKSQNAQNSIDKIISDTQLSEVESVYSADHSHSQQALNLEEDNQFYKEDIPLQPVKLQSIEAELNETDIETDRIIDSSVKLSSLYEYVPATKLKGLNDWVLESDHYKFYNEAGDFKADVIKESVLSIPEHLHVYTFEKGNNTKFPNPKKGITNVLDYYLFDGGSILPVLALDIQLNDVVLDMCAAPGGKALTILQTLLPHLLVANDVNAAKVKKLANVIETFLSDMYKNEKVLHLTQHDARTITNKDVYNKILVDVPCVVDRHVLNSDDDNIFKPTRLTERLNLPKFQSEILVNALKLVAVGGTVVYTTCSLSPIQNDGVVQVALKKVSEEDESVLIVKDMSEALSPLQYIFKFLDTQLKYGHMVVPTIANNWGPTYFCKIVKVR